MFKLFQRKPNPDLIDLEMYNANCKQWNAKGIPLMPPPAPPERMDRAWTAEESNMMEANRDAAQALYEYYMQE